MAAALDVLHSTELLEQILCHVPALQLLSTAGRVCKTWRTLVRTSPRLKWETWTYDSPTPPLSLVPPDSVHRTLASQDPDVLFKAWLEVIQDDELTQWLKQRLSYRYEVSPLFGLFINDFFRSVMELDEEDQTEEGLEGLLNRYIEKTGCLRSVKVYRPAAWETYIVRTHFEFTAQLPGDEQDLIYNDRDYSNWENYVWGLRIEHLDGDGASNGADFHSILRCIYETGLSSGLGGAGIAKRLWQLMKAERDWHIRRRNSAKFGMEAESSTLKRYKSIKLSVGNPQPDVHMPHGRLVYAEVYLLDLPSQRDSGYDVREYEPNLRRQKIESYDERGLIVDRKLPVSAGIRLSDRVRS